MVFLLTSFRFQLREQDHIADAFLAEEHHAQAVNADADAAGGRHAVFERDEEILVQLLLLAAGLMFPLTVAVLPLYLLLRDMGISGLWGLVIPQIAFGLPVNPAVGKTRSRSHSVRPWFWMSRSGWRRWR